MRKVTVSIGISAFNEESNIGHLINELLSQDVSGFILEKIVVISDGSKDKTVKVVNEIKSKFIELVEGKKREGLSFRQNQIFSLCNSDILVLLQADISIKDKKFLQKVIKPIQLKRADLVTVRAQELRAKTFFGKVINVSMEYKRHIFERLNQGKNIYTCVGMARAFSKQLYKTMKFSTNTGEDAFSYLYTKSHNFKYTYEKNAVILYKSPESFRDHPKKSDNKEQRFHYLLYLGFDQSFLN